MGYRKRMRRWEVRTPRFSTFSCHQRLPLLGRAEWRDEFMRVLARSRERLDFELIAWVVMPEHVHLIIVPNEVAVPDVLRSIKQPVAQAALRRWKRVGARILPKLEIAPGRYRYWQSGGGYDRNIRDRDELAEKIGYIHRNPVKRELVSNEFEWTWSSACAYAGASDGLIAIDRVTM